MMKRTLRSIATLMTLSLMFIILATSVFAASTSVTEYAYSNWRGNGSATARNNDEVIMAIVFLNTMVDEVVKAINAEDFIIMTIGFLLGWVCAKITLKLWPGLAEKILARKCSG